MAQIAARAKRGALTEEVRAGTRREAAARLSALVHAVLSPPQIELQHFAAAELTPSQVGALLHVRKTGAASVSAIADVIGLSRAATSHLLDRLVERGFVRRAEDPVDRRRKRIGLAREGERLLTLFDAAREKAAEGLLAKLPAETQARLDAAVREALDTLGRAATPEPS